MAGDILLNSVLIFLPTVIYSATFVVCFSAALAIVEGFQTLLKYLRGDSTNLEERR
jgi:hypothetical protein